jgi:hypothetical protein
MRLSYIFTLCLIVLVTIGQAQSDSTNLRRGSDYGLYPKKSPSNSSIQINGNYRFFGTYTRHLDPYLLNAVINDTVLSRNIFIGDDSQLPNLTIFVSGRPSPKVSWGFDLYMFQFLNGNIGTAYSQSVSEDQRPSIQSPLLDLRLGGQMGLLLGMNLYGGFQTQRGSWRTQVGGIQWINMSDLTMASFRGYNRFMLFERNPWDPTGSQLTSRYKQYYDQGSIDQDQRWGNRAFVGAVIEGSNLPHRISTMAMIGKTEQNGGFSKVPSFTYGGKIKKEWSAKNAIGINNINSFQYTDSTASDTYGFHIATVDWILEKKGFSFKGEAGMGQYFSPQHSGDWAELVQAKFYAPGTKKRPSFELHTYRIHPKVVNNNGVYWNTATPEYTINNIPAGQVGSTALLQPFGSSMVRLGQMTNNRQGVNLNVEYGMKKIKFAGGAGFASEITPSAEVITVGNPVNSQVRSRLWRWAFPTGVGPYGRYSDIYRDVYQTINLSDDSSNVTVFKKHFAMAELQTKFSTKIAGKELYIFSLLQAGSSQRSWSPTVVTTEDAYIRQYTSEVELYYAISRGVMINAYYGYERTIGNYRTDIDDSSRRPRNQYGEGVGVGLDVDLGRNARLYFRHRWFYFTDHSFAYDHFRGRELTVELKAFF